MKNLIFVLFVLLITHIGIFAQNKAEKPVICNNFECVVAKAKLLIKQKKLVSAMKQLNCARYYIAGKDFTKHQMIDSLSIDIIKGLTNQR